MPMQQPLRITTDDGFQTEITAQPDGSLRITVTETGGRMWQAERATIEEAIAVAYQIRTEQGAVLGPAEQQTQAAEGTPPLDPPAAPLEA